jgi:GTP cyclohydrolase III
MTEEPTRKLAVLLHADVIGSTALVQFNETVAHARIQDALQRFSRIITQHNGTTQEIRGDALVSEFSRASDAVTAACDIRNLVCGKGSGLGITPKATQFWWESNSYLGSVNGLMHICAIYWFTVLVLQYAQQKARMIV